MVWGVVRVEREREQEEQKEDEKEKRKRMKRSSRRREEEEEEEIRRRSRTSCKAGMMSWRPSCPVHATHPPTVLRPVSRSYKHRRLSREA